MFYKGFRKHITRRFGVILKNWPLKVFDSPSQLTSMPELTVLYNAFKSGATKFCQLSPEEWAAWEDSGKPVVTGINGVPLGEDAEQAEAPFSAQQGNTEPSTSGGTPSAEPQPEPQRPDASRPDASIGALSSSPVAPECIPTPPTGPPQSESFVFSFGDTTPATAPKKRKTRSDKGKPRGPNTRTKGQPASKRQRADAASSPSAS